MPTAHNGLVKLNYATQWDGYPLLLIVGLGVTAMTWWRSVDNRGMGRSGQVAGEEER
jgi:hypothetical protein